jgi:hypothetical protein
MVGVRLKAALSTANMLQASFGAFSANSLQSISAALVALAYTFDLGTTIDCAVTIRGKIDNTKVNPKYLINLSGGWFVNIARHQKIKLATAIHEITFALSGLQQLALACSALKGDYLTVQVPNRPDTDRLIGKIER